MILTGLALSNRCVIKEIPQNGYLRKRFEPNKLLRRSQEVDNLTEIEYNCIIGFVLKGSNSNTCLNGDWQNNVPECKLHCSSTELCREEFIVNCYYIEGENLESTECQTLSESDTIAIIDCHRGFNSSNGIQQTLTCGNDGRWHPAPSTCNEHLLDDLELSTTLQPIDNKFESGRKIQYF